MDIEGTDNPSEAEDTLDSTLDSELETETQEYDDDGNPIEEEEDEEDVDLDDETKLRVSKAAALKLKELKEGNLRQSDYTKKTQEIAESRKAFEAEREQVRQMDAVELMARGDLANVNAQIGQYEQFDWATARGNAQATDSENFDRAQMDLLDAHWQQYQLLKSKQQKVVQLLGFKAQERQSKQQQSFTAQAEAAAKLMDEGTPELKKAIPDWSRAKAATLTDAMVKHFGIPRHEFDGIDDAKLYMVMEAAVFGAEQRSRQKKTATIQKQQEVTPAAKATGGRSPIPPGRLDDRLSTDEWVKRRNAQVRQRS